MKKKIYKYSLPNMNNIIDLPMYSEIIKFDKDQYYHLCIWVLFPADVTESERHELMIIGTGEPFEMDDFSYVGTITGVEGWLVWHLLDRKI